MKFVKQCSLFLSATALWCAPLVTSWAQSEPSHSDETPEEAPLNPPHHAPHNGNDRDRETESPDALVTMHFQDVDIPVLAKFISEITKKNFIVDEKVRGKVTIISPTKVTPDEAYAIFQSVLQVKGFTTVPSGRIVKILPNKDAKQSGAPVVFNGELAASGDEVVTRLIPLRHVNAADLMPVLQPLVSSDGVLQPYPQTNSLVLTDTALNVKRLIGMLEELDIEGFERRTEVIALQYAIATDLAKQVEDIMREQGDPENPSPQPRIKVMNAASSTTSVSSSSSSSSGSMGNLQGVRVLSDERTNSLIVMCGVREMKAVRRLVRQLDVPLPPGSSKIHVYPLKYANAEELLPVLADLIGGRTGGSGSISLEVPRRDRRTTRERRFGDRQKSRSGSGLGDRMPALSSQPPGSPGGGRASGSAPEFGSEVTITADPATNSLLISASPQDFETLAEVLAQLDVRRKQVYVEAMILEVSMERAREMGIELQSGFSINGEGVGLGRTNLGSLNSALTNPGSLAGLLLAAASNRTIELPNGTRVPAQVALLRAAQNSTDINVLSSPTLLTADNQEAEIIVGQNVPFVASRATDSADLGNLFATVEREDVGITLRLTPQISEGDTVRLDVYEEVSAIVPTTVGDPNLVGPTTSVRSASTTVVAKSGQTVVIGGLISDNTTSQSSGVPFLQDVPILGNFFRTDGKQGNKINLLIFLTPHIVRDDTEIATRTQDERDRFRSFLSDHNAPSKWHKQLDRPSFALPTGKESGGVLLPGTVSKR